MVLEKEKLRFKRALKHWKVICPGSKNTIRSSISAGNGTVIPRQTLIPFFKDAVKYLKFKYKNVTADAGYESEENYLFLELNRQNSYIKPANYEISKSRKYRNDIGRIENMEYDAESDISTCRNRKKLTADHIRHSKSRTGYVSEKQFTDARTAMSIHIKMTVLKETTVKHLWKNGQRHCRLQKHF